VTDHATHTEDDARRYARAHDDSAERFAGVHSTEPIPTRAEVERDERGW
jgi:hypothetical protein